MNDIELKINDYDFQFIDDDTKHLCYAWVKVVTEEDCVLLAIYDFETQCIEERFYERQNKNECSLEDFRLRLLAEFRTLLVTH